MLSKELLYDLYFAYLTYIIGSDLLHQDLSAQMRHKTVIVLYQPLKFLGWPTDPSHKRMAKILEPLSFYLLHCTP
jgi:hypothetical protein